MLYVSSLLVFVMLRTSEFCAPGNFLQVQKKYQLVSRRRSCVGGSTALLPYPDFFSFVVLRY
jgi:hypothetical protein